MQKRYKNQVEFLCIYVREAHPTDGWRMITNDLAGVSVKQPTQEKERAGVAKQCCEKLKVTMPMLVDDMDDRVGHLYSGMPDRLYLIDRHGKVAYKSGRGPFGFKPGEMEQSLAMLLLDNGGIARTKVGRFPGLNDDDAWKFLPSLEKGEKRPLPSWARVLAEPLPRTTAVMLELDYAHRVRSPLDPKLRGKLRWAVADANNCEYGRAYAGFDLRQHGLDEAAIRELSGGKSTVPEAERAAIDFVRKLTTSADTITDEEVEKLKRVYGEANVVAIVLLAAYGNFQDRLLLALDVPVESSGPLKPLAVRFSRKATTLTVRRESSGDQADASSRGQLTDPEWRSRDFGALQKAMDEQRARQGRISVPEWEDVRRLLPADLPAKQPIRIRWSLVCMGHQPELAAAWGRCLRTFGEESKQDRVFEESLFWVITRSINCFY